VVSLFGSSHPGPVLAVTAAATLYATALHRGARGDAIVAAAVLGGQLAIGWHNDFLDAERDEIARRADKPVAKGRIKSAHVGIAALVACIATIPLSLLSGWKAGVIHLIAVASALNYNAVLKRTVISFVPFAVSFGLLPCFCQPRATRRTTSTVVGTGRRERARRRRAFAERASRS